MNEEVGNRGRTAAYMAVHRAISALLYEVDPWGAGSTVGAPVDEYDDAATRLIPVLVRVDADTSVYPDTGELPPELIARLRELAEPLRAGDSPEH